MKDCKIYVEAHMTIPPKPIGYGVVDKYGVVVGTLSHADVRLAYDQYVAMAADYEAEKEKRAKCK